MKNLRSLCHLMYFIIISKEISPAEPSTSSTPSSGQRVCHKGQEIDPMDGNKLIWTNDVTCLNCHKTLLGGVNIQAANRIPLVCDHQNAGDTTILPTTSAKGTKTSITFEPGGPTDVSSGMTSSAAVATDGTSQTNTILATLTTSAKGTTTGNTLGPDGSTEVNSGVTSSAAVTSDGTYQTNTILATNSAKGTTTSNSLGGGSTEVINGMTSSLTGNTAGQSMTSIRTTGQSVTSAATTGQIVTSAATTTGQTVKSSGTTGQSVTSVGSTGQSMTSITGQSVTSVGTTGQSVTSFGTTGQSVTAVGTTEQSVTSVGTTGQSVTSGWTTGQSVTSVGTTEQSVTSVGTTGQSVTLDPPLVTTTSGISTVGSYTSSTATGTAPGFNLPTLPPLSPSIFGDCSSALALGFATSGIYLLDILAGFTSFRKWCDMESDGGGWLVFQRRQDGSVHFNRTWQEYQDGFGSPDGEYWMGNEALSLITSANNYELRIDMEDWEGNTAHATYKSFKVTGEKYTMDLGQYSNPQSTAGDSLGYADGRDFSTIDRDNDNNPTLHCMEKYGGGWWTNNCYDSNLNCYYRHGPDLPDSKGIVWFHWKGINYAIKKTEMKIRRI